MKVYKEKQFLIFDFENGKTVKYDFATNQAIGKNGKPVKDLCFQLRGFTIDEIIESCVDTNYGYFLKFVKENDTSICRNIGTLLKKTKQFYMYESIFSAGVKRVRNDFKHYDKKIPNGLIKLCKKHDICLTMRLVNYYESNPNLINYIFDTNFEFNTLSKKIYHIYQQKQDGKKEDMILALIF